MMSIFTLSLIFVLKNKKDLAQVESIVAMVLMAIVILLAIPIFGLTGFHMVLVSRGRTTNEQVTGKFKGGYNPFSRGCWNNCCYAQFGPQYPSLLKPQKYVVKQSVRGGGDPPISTILPPQQDINNRHAVGMIQNQVSSARFLVSAFRKNNACVRTQKISLDKISLDKIALYKDSSKNFP